MSVGVALGIAFGVLVFGIVFGGFVLPWLTGTTPHGGPWGGWPDEQENHDERRESK